MGQITTLQGYFTEETVRQLRPWYNGHRLTANDFNAEHERCLAFVKRAVAESKAERVQAREMDRITEGMCRPEGALCEGCF